MSSSRDRGSVLAADLVLGCAIVVVLAAAAGAAGRIIDAGQSSREAARTGAVAIARGWETDDALARARVLALTGSEISAETTAGSAVVAVSVDVALPHPVARRVTMSVNVTESVPVSPYRSRRDG